MMKKSRATQILLWIIAVLVVGYLTSRFVPGYFERSSQFRSIESLSQEAEQMNRGLPAMLDKETELMITESAPGMFIYKYRLVNVSAPVVDRQNFASGAKMQLVPMVCSRPETRGDFLSKGVTMRYAYFDKDRQHIVTIDVTPADCGL
jgi:hypothetical protein